MAALDEGYVHQESKLTNMNESFIVCGSALYRIHDIINNHENKHNATFILMKNSLKG